MSTLETLISDFESLENNEKEQFYRIIKNKLNIREEKLISRINEAEINYFEGNTKKGNLKELFEDIIN